MASALTEAMRERGLSYRDLGFLSGLSPSYLCKIAAGQRRPAAWTALKIAKALQVDPLVLFGDGTESDQHDGAA